MRTTDRQNQHTQASLSLDQGKHWTTITLYTAQDGDYYCSPVAHSTLGYLDKYLSRGSHRGITDRIIQEGYWNVTTSLFSTQDKAWYVFNRWASVWLTVGEPETDTLIDQLSIVTHGEYTALLSSAPLIWGELWLKYDTFTVKRCLNHDIIPLKRCKSTTF